MIVAAVGLRREARLLARTGARFVVGGGDAARLERELDDVARDAAGILSIGLCGALDPALRPGDWVVADAVRDGAAVTATDAAWTDHLRGSLGAAPGDVLGSDTIVADAAAKAGLRARTGAAAVDMESHVAARVARRHALPLAVARVVSDAAGRSLPHAVRVGMRPDGGTDLPAVLRSLLADPRQLPALLRVAADAERAFRALLRGGRRLGGGLTGDRDPV